MSVPWKAHTRCIYQAHAHIESPPKRDHLPSVAPHTTGGAGVHAEPTLLSLLQPLATTGVGRGKAGGQAATATAGGTQPDRGGEQVVSSSLPIG